MKNKFFIGGGVEFLCLFSAAIINLPIMALTLKIADMFVALDFFPRMIISLVVSILTVSGITAAVCYLAAYRSASFNATLFSRNFLIAVLIQLALSLLLKFKPFIAGGTLYLAGIFEHGSAFSSLDDVEYIGLIDYLSAFVILSVITYAASIICGIIGKRKRLKDRENLLSDSGNK